MAKAHLIEALKIVMKKAPDMANEAQAALDSKRDRDLSTLTQSLVKRFMSAGIKITPTESRTMVAALLHEEDQRESAAYTVTRQVRISEAMDQDLITSAAKAGRSVSEEIRRRLEKPSDL